MRRWLAFGRACALWLVALAALESFDPVGVVEAQSRRKRVALVLIVSPRSEVRDISLSRLRVLYSARRSSGGIIPLNMTNGRTERVSFDRAVLRLRPEEVGIYWVQSKVRGNRPPPRSFSRATTIGKLVARFPQAIGYVRADQLPSGVRPVAIDGRSHTDPDYPLWVEVAR